MPVALPVGDQREELSGGGDLPTFAPKILSNE
jgi:hypothetical protein